MFSDMFQPMFGSMFGSMFGQSRICQALRFDGVDDYGQLASAAIDITADIDIEFWMPSDISAGTQKRILSQSDFLLFISQTSGNLVAIVGGASSAVANIGTFDAGKKYRWQLIGNQSFFTDVESGTLITQRTFNRGADVNPSNTLIGASPGPSNFYIGLMPDLKINGVYWAMDQVGQTTQPSSPSGNDMTLFNTTPEQWEVIPCSLRP